MQENLFDKTLSNGIKSVVIKNFRGVDYKHLIFNGEHFNEFAPNKSFKTTKLEAIVWALNNKLLDNTSKIDNLRPIGKPDDTVVSVEIEFMSGTKVRREWFQKYVTSQKDGEKYLDKPQQVLYVDEVKQTSLEKGQQLIYNELGLNEALSNVPNKVDLFMLLHVPQYIRVIENKVARELFESIVGEPNLFDIIKEYPQDVQDELKSENYKFETVKSKHESNIKQVKGSMNGLKSLAEKYETEKSNQTKIDVKAIQNNIDKLNDELMTLRANKLKGKDELTRDIELEISKLQGELGKKKLAFNQEATEISKRGVQLEETLKKNIDNKVAEIENNKKTISQTQIKVENYLNTKAQYEKMIEQLNNQLKDLKGQFDEVMKPTFVTAPISKERFDIYTTEELKGVREEKVKTLKSKGLSLNEEIKNYKTKVLELNQDIEKGNSTIKELEEKEFSLNTDLVNLKKELSENKDVKELKSKYVDLKASYDKDEQTIVSQIKTLEKQKNDVLTANQTFTVGDSEKENELKQQIDKLQSQIFEANTQKNYEQEIKDIYINIENQQKQIDFSEKVVVFMKRLETDKLVALEKQVEKVFGGDVKIELFDYTQDGKLTPIFNIKVKDTLDGNFVDLINGINFGEFEINVIRLTNKIRQKLGIRDTFVLLDGIESIGLENRKTLYGLGQQVISNEVDKEK